MTTNNSSFDFNSTLLNSGNRMKWTNILLGVCLYAIVLITILGNSLVLVAVAKFKKLQTVFNFYVINLAITDIAVAVTAMSFYTTNNILGFWPFGEFLCGVWIFFDYGMTFASVFTLIVISLDRFWSVTWSVHYRAHHNKRKCVKLIIGLWIFMIVLWLPPCVLDRVRNAIPNQCIWEPSKNKEFVIVIALVGHHGSFLIMMTCYLRVFYVLMKRAKVGAGTASKDHSTTPNAPSVVIKDDHTHNKSHASSGEMSGSNSIIDGEKSAIWTTPNAHSTVDVTLKPKVYGNHLTPYNPPVFENSSVHGENSSMYNERLRRLNSNNKRNDDKKYEKNERRVFNTLTYIIVGYIICWLPFHIVFDVSAVSPQSVSDNVFTVTFWMTYINSTMNPFLYNFSSTEFRRAFRDLLCRKKSSTNVSNISRTNVQI